MPWQCALHTANHQLSLACAQSSGSWWAPAVLPWLLDLAGLPFPCNPGMEKAADSSHSWQKPTGFMYSQLTPTHCSFTGHTAHSLVLAATTLLQVCLSQEFLALRQLALWRKLQGVSSRRAIRSRQQWAAWAGSLMEAMPNTQACLQPMCRWALLFCRRVVNPCALAKALQ